MERSVATTETASTTAAPVRLGFLGGAEPPPALGDDLLVLRRLPAEALEKLWQILLPTLDETISKQTGELLDVFCTAYKVDPAELGHAVSACRFVVREAAQRDVPAEALAQDLEHLCPGEPLVKELVLAGYEPARVLIRRQILVAALTDHGKLLLDARWRMDTVQASERGAKLQMPLVQLTLHYKEGAETGRITLQVLPDMMAKLHALWEQIRT